MSNIETNNNNNDNNNKEQQQSKQSLLLKQENELKNESKYISLFNNIITKHYKDLFTNSSSHKNENNDTNTNIKYYKHETKILKNILSKQREAIGIGTLVGVTTFLSVRYLPNIIIYSIGNEEKIQKFKNAQQQRKKLNVLRRSIVPILFETAFSIIIGFAGYKKAIEYNGNNNDLFHDIAKCPLVQGRSLLSERICKEWLNVAYYNYNNGKEDDTNNDINDNSIPPIFWKNVHEEKVKNNSSWKNIQYFAHNCIKRQAYEQKLLSSSLAKNNRKKQLDGDDATSNNNFIVIVPSPGVPDDILSDDEIKSLTKSY